MSSIIIGKYKIINGAKPRGGYQEPSTKNCINSWS
jgi:hypothetical protein